MSDVEENIDLFFCPLRNYLDAQSMLDAKQNIIFA
jgi:hypothetical protein